MASELNYAEAKAHSAEILSEGSNAPEWSRNLAICYQAIAAERDDMWSLLDGITKLFPRAPGETLGPAADLAAPVDDRH